MQDNAVEALLKKDKIALIRQHKIDIVSWQRKIAMYLPGDLFNMRFACNRVLELIDMIYILQNK